jgi:hypothetical protein
LDVAASPCAEDLEQNLADALADVARVVSGSACAAEGLSLRIARGADPSSWSIDLEDAAAAAPRCTEEWLEALDEVSELQRDHGCDVTSEIHCKAAARPGVLMSDAARMSLVCAQPARARIAAARVPKARLRSACRLDALLRSLEQRVAVLLDDDDVRTICGRCDEREEARARRRRREDRALHCISVGSRQARCSKDRYELADDRAARLDADQRDWCVRRA